MSELSYLEKLLDGVKVEWKTLEKVLKRTKGTKITAGQMKALHKDNAPLKLFAGGKTVAFVDFKDIPEKDINREPSIIVKSRGIIEFEYYDKPFSHKNEMWSYHSNNDAISIKYIYYFLKINEGYLEINPCIPKDWKNYQIQYKWKETIYNIEVKNPNGKNTGVTKVLLDGNETENHIKLDGTRKIYKVEILL